VKWTNEQLTKLIKAAQANLAEMGFVGLDYNMAVICICARLTNFRVKFMGGTENDDDNVYQRKLSYWISKRDFCHLHVDSEEALIDHAMKEYKVAA
jgi:hypothetical protein